MSHPVNILNYTASIDIYDQMVLHLFMAPKCFVHNYHGSDYCSFVWAPWHISVAQSQCFLVGHCPYLGNMNTERTKTEDLC